MRCPECGRENAAEMKFCGECGTRLTVVCRECGARNAPSQKFCGECGARLGSEASSRQFPSPDAYTPKHLAEKILTSKTSLEGERKQVTVLFADLKGSMELLADRDPEEARKLLDPVIERMMEAVHQYEGTVNQVMGDGIMALFGAPLSHEDHAVRACYAALRMQESVNRYEEGVRRAHGVNVQIRVGLNSGQVLVRAIGSDLHMDYTAVGQTTHLAARMEQLANPGSILLTTSTLELVEGLIAVKSLGPVPVKGLGDPVEVYELKGTGPARTRLHAAARRGLSRFVGRHTELEQLHRAQQLTATGHGQIVAVVGEAGVGKSRLLYEFTHSHRLRDCLILEGASLSYGKATSYLPVIDLLKGYFRIQDQDDPRHIREKVTGKLLTLDETFRSMLPALLALLDLPIDDAAWQKLDPTERRRRTLDAVKRLLLREAREQALLLIFEDLHWIDSETQALLDALVESLGSARLLLLVTYRREYQHNWGGKTYYCQLRVDALPVESAAELLQALLGDDLGLAQLKHLLVKRGNPFFLEETIRTLVETKVLVGTQGEYRLTQSVQVIQVPATVQAVLAARIDRLSVEDKRLLQIASVVGKDVPVVLLQAIAELSDEALSAGLHRLQSAEFLYETGLFPDLEYAFKHALTHEVTYSGLLHDRRRSLHARIVDVMETLHHDRLGEHIERLAHHAVRGELRERAVLYLRRAGLKAVVRSALPEAVTWFQQARDVISKLPEEVSTLERDFEICFDLRAAELFLGHCRQALGHLHEAGTIAEKLRDDRRRGRVYAFTTNIHSLLGQPLEALATGTQALALARELDDLELRIFATSFLAQAHYIRAEYEQAVQLAKTNLTALPTDLTIEHAGIGSPISVYDRCWLVSSLVQLGRFDAATEHDDEAIRLAEPTQRAITLGLALRAAGTLRLLRGQWAKARPLIERWIAVILSGNVHLQLPFAIPSSAWVLAQLGEATEALNRLREGEQELERSAAQGVVFQHGWGYHSLGRACLLLDRVEDACRLANCAIEFSSMNPGYAAHALHLLGDIAVHRRRLDESENHYRQALAIAEPRGMRPLVAHCHLGFGKHHRQRGNRAQAQEHLTAAMAMYREMAMTYWPEQAEAELRALG
jgi:class 3 adenylate cyclase/tetratricopeptide (TPR) repeat protein